MEYSTTTLTAIVLTIVIMLQYRFILNVCSKLKKQAFAHLLCKIIPGYNKSVNKYKYELFSHVNELLESNGGEIFELGVGCGANLSYYPKTFSVKLTAVEPNTYCKSYLQKRLKEYPNIILEKYVSNFGEDMKDIADNSVSCIVCTIVLCSVQNQLQVFQEIKRILKPGGMFYFMEHIAADENSWARLFQKVLNFPWKMIFDGCQLTRDTGKVIENAGFKDVTCNYVYSKSGPLFFLVRRHVYGWAEVGEI